MQFPYESPIHNHEIDTRSILTNQISQFHMSISYFNQFDIFKILNQGIYIAIHEQDKPFQKNS